jgi:hypothetical protein
MRKNMTGKKAGKPVNVVNDKGNTVMAMNSMKRAGDKITINGIMMGAWPSDMFVGPEDVWNMVGMVLRSPSVITYFLSLPFILRRIRQESRKKAQAIKA